MARMSYPRAGESLPAPLPPETRTVGQLVAETIRLFGRRFVISLPLGAVLGALGVVGFDRSANAQTLVLWAFAPALTAAYVAAAALVGEVRLDRRRAATAFAVGLLVFAPFPVLIRLYVLPGVVFFAVFGLAVPAAVIERLGVGDALRRGAQLARADLMHAIGGLITLALVYELSRVALLLLLRTQSDQTQEVAGFLADVVLAPLLFLGAALLYVDQAARMARVAR
jgi:hypothetical protein